MNVFHPESIDGLALRSSATPGSLLDLVNRYGGALPTDYAQFLRYSDGAEGAMGQNYLQLWSASKVIELNEAYAVDEFAPGLLLIGTDGGNTGYGFDLRHRSPGVIEVPLVGMSWEEAKEIANSFAEFLLFMRSA